MLPVIIEELIQKVTDSKIHTDKRQHYAATLQLIIDKGQKALDKYENDKKLTK